MQQQTSLHIATPCHEDWNGMTPAGKGKFCASCAKQVVDFTLMSDTQILQFLSQQNGSLCGRFDADQLARPLLQPTLNKKKSWYLAFALPLSLFFQKSFGQTGKQPVGKSSVKVEQKPTDTTRIVLGKFLSPTLAEVTLHGTVRDEKGDAIEGAVVMEKGTRNGVVTDSGGRFSLKLHSQSDSVSLRAMAVGYLSLAKEVSLQEANINLLLAAPRGDEPELANAGIPTTSLSRTAGLVSVCKRVTKAQKTDSLIKKTLRLHTFTVYPNPACSGSQVQVTVKKKGDYELQLLSAGSVLLKTEIMPVQSDNTTVSFELPPNLAAGVYYLRLLDVNNKASYLEKILVN